MPLLILFFSTPTKPLDPGKKKTAHRGRVLEFGVEKQNLFSRDKTSCTIWRILFLMTLMKYPNGFNKMAGVAWAWLEPWLSLFGAGGGILTVIAKKK